MSVFFLILKILGILLLSILIILLLGIVFILFSPFRYKLKASYYDKADFNLKAIWLFSLFSTELHYVNGELYGYWKFLLKKHVIGKESSNRKHKNKKEINSNNKVIEEKSSESYLKVDTNVVEQKNKNLIDFDADDFIDIENIKRVEAERGTKAKTSRKRSRNKKSLIKKIKRFLKNIKNILTKISDIIHNEAYQKAIKHLLQEIVYVLKHVLPKKMNLKAKYSAGGPDITAILFGVIAMFPVAYTNHWLIEPDFEADKAYINGETKIKGNTCAFFPMKAFLRIWVDKNCRKLYNDFNS